ncbi:rhodanese-related sulfurtransferase [Listeria fleischmannii 1991]|uniref:Uncharacterized conserved protein n=2 Tax=Listeria fleischmannii TaxID=1069827 RepID=A0A2X3HKX8_9LIST|nr:rhodanese-like domain-containing protein [Listeria fleischmannii]EMG27319.1 rhodanese-related sulfurtransferase [Listeria fleischmannii subsp. fleischmannii LU2006-1]KMT57837.1 rhodanese-related sulfurtransferase [Listeria fleischmannii 1991]SQC71784.1 Uncharacterized conserved protein [Listeria fleischmannii subsp. fleischmannii]
MYSSISNDEFYQKETRGKLIVLDVREVDEFQRGHIPSSKNLPLSELGNRYHELDKGTVYYIICQFGGRSARACDFLSNKGLNVKNVMGGMSSWKGEVV